jgi:opacity protein-like surface antigen
MSTKHATKSLAIAVVFAAGLVSPGIIQAQDPPPARPSTQARPPAAVNRGGSRLGVDVFGGAGVTWPTATKSFDAVGLGPALVEFGGGARVTGIWRTLFAQVGAARWSDTGERAFVDSTGAVFPLGIPLSVKATYVDVSVGSKTGFRSGKTVLWSYVGVGAGVVKYSERSPFAQPGEDLDTTSASYHVLGGVEIPLVKWLAVVVDGRYRYIPDVLNKGGVSAALKEKTLGGVQASVGLRLGFAGTPPPRRIPDAPRRPPVTERQRMPAGPPAGPPADTGLIVEAAPVFLLPDATRTPLRTLPPNTAVTVLEEKPDWIRIRFNDPQYGQRVGYVQRKFVQLKKQNVP